MQEQRAYERTRMIVFISLQAEFNGRKRERNERTQHIIGREENIFGKNASAHSHTHKRSTILGRAAGKKKEIKHIQPHTKSIPMSDSIVFRFGVLPSFAGIFFRLAFITILNSNGISMVWFGCCSTQT